MEWFERLKQARIEKGLTQKQCADAMGFTPAAWQAYERGRRVPSLLQARDICAVLGVSLDWLVSK